MLKKTRSGADKVKVTFVLPPQSRADHVHVVGDFNEWEASTPMKRDKEGRWRATLELDAGREYRFRYLVDGNHWINDEAADRYEPNPFGADNCVLTTPEAAGAAVRAAGGVRVGAGAGATSKGSPARGTKAGTGPSAKGKSAGEAAGQKSRGSGASRGAADKGSRGKGA